MLKVHATLKALCVPGAAGNQPIVVAWTPEFELQPLPPIGMALAGDAASGAANTAAVAAMIRRVRNLFMI